MKHCGKCKHQHLTIPAGGINHTTGYYFQCAAGCNSTLFIPSPESRAKIDAYKAQKGKQHAPTIPAHN